MNFKDEDDNSSIEFDNDNDDWENSSEFEPIMWIHKNHSD
jgi:hypothetical protein